MPLAEVSVAVSKGVGYHVVRHLDTSLMAERSLYRRWPNRL